MAKAQKRSNRELRKPKGDKAKPVAAVDLQAEHPVNALMKKSKGKL